MITYLTARNHILEVCQWAYSQYDASAIPLNSNKTAFINALITQFPSMTTVSINEILNGSPSTKRLPDHINWSYNDGGTQTQNQNSGLQILASALSMMIMKS